jgi:NAD(P)H-hydrate epimerase
MTLAYQIRPLSRQEVRSLDERAARELGLPTLVLMENAGRGAAALLAERGAAAGGSLPRVLVVCGPGNNGGDGGVLARHLDAWGYPVRVVWLASPEVLRGDAAVQWQILARSGIDQEARPGGDGLDALAADADWLVDGLLGTGLTRPVEGPLRQAVAAMNGAGKPILALDLPSGLDADAGVPLGAAVRATVTATFVAPKLGFAVPGAERFTGEVAVIDIGLPRCLLVPFLGSAIAGP